MNKKQQEQEQKALKMLNECNNIMQAYKKGKSDLSDLSELTEAVRTFTTLSIILEVAFQVKFSDKRITILNLSDNFRTDINKMYYDRYSKFY